MDFDYIIVGGGSAGSVLANRLSARSANKVLVCEAGEDTPPGKEPPEVLDSYSGTAYLNNRFLWKDLKVSTEVVSPQQRSHRAQAPAAQVRAGARARRRLVDQRPDGQSRRADRLRRMARARRHGLEVGQRAALLQEARARSRLRRRMARQGWPDPRAPRARGAMAGPRQGARRGVQARRLQVPARPERHLRGRLLSRHHLERQRAARLGLDRLSQRRGAQAPEPDDLHAHAGDRAAVRGLAVRRRQGAGQWPAAGVPRPRRSSSPPAPSTRPRI